MVTFGHFCFDIVTDFDGVHQRRMQSEAIHHSWTTLIVDRGTDRSLGLPTSTLMSLRATQHPLHRFRLHRVQNGGMTPSQVILLFLRNTLGGRRDIVNRVE